MSLDVSWQKLCDRLALGFDDLRFPEMSPVKAMGFESRDDFCRAILQDLLENQTCIPEDIIIRSEKFDETDEEHAAQSLDALYWLFLKRFPLQAPFDKALYVPFETNGTDSLDLGDATEWLGPAGFVPTEILCQTNNGDAHFFVLGVDFDFISSQSEIDSLIRKSRSDYLPLLAVSGNGSEIETVRSLIFPECQRGASPKWQERRREIEGKLKGKSQPLGFGVAQGKLGPLFVHHEEVRGELRDQGRSREETKWKIRWKRTPPAKGLKVIAEFKPEKRAESIVNSDRYLSFKSTGILSPTARILFPKTIKNDPSEYYLFPFDLSKRNLKFIDCPSQKKDLVRMLKYFRAWEKFPKENPETAHIVEKRYSDFRLLFTPRLARAREQDLNQFWENLGLESLYCLKSNVKSSTKGALAASMAERTPDAKAEAYSDACMALDRSKSKLKNSDDCDQTPVPLISHRIREVNRRKRRKAERCT